MHLRTRGVDVHSAYGVDGRAGQWLVQIVTTIRSMIVLPLVMMLPVLLSAVLEYVHRASS
jgi:hypothetical protein